MANYPIPLNLGTVAFTTKSDVVKVTGPIADGGPDAAIYLDAPKDTLNGDDTIQATVNATFTTGAGFFRGIRNSDVLNLGAGVDKVIAEVNATVHAPADWSFTGYSGAETNLGAGDDVLKGRVTVGGDGFSGYAIGILSGNVIGGAGNDEVNGYAKLTATPSATASDVTVYGVAGGPINLGADKDVVIATAEASITTSVGALHVAGLHDVLLDTGEGNDSIIASGSLAISAGGGDMFALGVFGANIATGGGKDDLTFKGVYSGSGDDINVRVYGLYDSFVDTGAQDDYLKAVAKGGGNAWATEAGYYTLGDGNDTFDVSASGGHYETVGIRYGTMNAGKGNDGIYVIATGSAADSVTHGLYRTGAFDMGEGADTLDVRATSTKGPAYGISETVGDIVTGNGNDKIIAIAKAGAGHDGYGLNGAVIFMNDGDDFIQARGSTAGMHNSAIHTGAGNDVIDVQNGIGGIEGGVDTDLLKLFGAKGDYSFDAQSTPDHVLIKDVATNGDVTLLDVYDVELFQFGTGPVLHYADLFI